MKECLLGSFRSTIELRPRALESLRKSEYFHRDFEPHWHKTDCFGKVQNEKSREFPAEPFPNRSPSPPVNGAGL